MIKISRVKRNPKQPMEFSKKILIVMFLITLIIVACAITMSYMTQTTDVYAYLIPSIFVELSVGTAFYYKKAEKENLLKIEQSFEKEDENI
ncbi:hypothetical protein [Sporosarcina sp. FSL K6-5500]|uniref:hypothetical protein n=1 Tax=Sporosarcina sp. FSL K6-5500 TaxID=2921558 RepID=UPI0030F7AED5